jgi:hypothetical protein
MTAKLLAAALLFTTIPTVANAQPIGASSSGHPGWCYIWINGRPHVRLCKG